MIPCWTEKTSEASHQFQLLGVGSKLCCSDLESCLARLVLREICNDAIFYNESVLFGELNISPIPSESGCVKVAFAFISIKVIEKPTNILLEPLGQPVKNGQVLLKRYVVFPPWLKLKQILDVLLTPHRGKKCKKRETRPQLLPEEACSTGP